MKALIKLSCHAECVLFAEEALWVSAGDIQKDIQHLNECSLCASVLMSQRSSEVYEGAGYTYANEHCAAQGGMTKGSGHYNILFELRSVV